LNIKRETTIQS